MKLQQRVGSLVAAHRRRAGLTQQRLAEVSELSPDTISLIETGGTGLSFSTIEKLATALRIDPGELFIVSSTPGGDLRRPLLDLTAQLSKLSDSDLAWVSELLTSALKTRR